MSYNTGESRDPHPLAPPYAQLRPFPQKNSCRRITAKAPAGALDEQVLSAAPLPDDQMQPSEGPEHVSPDAAGMSTFLQEMDEDAREAHDSMVKFFLTDRRSAGVNAYYSLLPAKTQAYLNSIGKPLL